MGESKKDAFKPFKWEMSVKGDFDSIISIERTDLCFVKV
jgi:hypothetical protein